MDTFFALLALCEGNPLVTGGTPPQRPVTWNFDVFFDLRLNKRFSKQSRCQWFEMPWCSLWRHCNDTVRCHNNLVKYNTNLNRACNDLVKHKLDFEVTKETRNLSKPHPLRWAMGCLLKKKSENFDYVILAPGCIWNGHLKGKYIRHLYFYNPRSEPIVTRGQKQVNLLMRFYSVHVDGLMQKWVTLVH